jgi:hypothetical protein
MTYFEQTPTADEHVKGQGGEDMLLSRLTENSHLPRSSIALPQPRNTLTFLFSETARSI